MKKFFLFWFSNSILHFPSFMIVINGICPAITASSPSVPRTDSLSAFPSYIFPSGDEMTNLKFFILPPSLLL